MYWYLTLGFMAHYCFMPVKKGYELRKEELPKLILK